MPRKSAVTNNIKLVGLPAAEIISDYQVGYTSRIASLIGRKEVLTGKAKFGIFGDGKEVPQLAMARAFRHGDWRSGYYRDQTFMMAVGALDVKKFFAQLYADTDIEREPASGGRQMNAHFASRFLDKQGNWLNQLMIHNTSADASPTACQMPRLLGLGYASKLYRNIPELADGNRFSKNGGEVAFGTIGNASTSEGLFWETLNAMGVLQIPIVMSVWDDGYGISVPNEYQTTKGSISKICQGFHPEDGEKGVDVITVEGWDYPKLLTTYAAAVEKARKTHQPCLIHVTELTQPQGHSTSGSHERYKGPQRLKWEEDNDCLAKMRQWMIAEGIATDSALQKLEEQAAHQVEADRREAWEEFRQPLKAERAELQGLLASFETNEDVASLSQKLGKATALGRREILATARQALVALRDTSGDAKQALVRFCSEYHMENNDRYSGYLLSEGNKSPVVKDAIEPIYGENPEILDGRQVVQRIFDYHLGRDPRLFIIGEDIGVLGGVNLEFDGLQDKHGELRVTDTGIREATIMGQGIGAALRGLRPVVDIQYLDYLLYAFQVMSDDLATLHYRTAGGQAAPVIVRTKGHRLEGVWHTGSPMGTVINGVRGMHVCVPRDMVQAAGMYNTLLEGNDPALVIEVLNGYRVKERLPENLTSFRVPLGVPEVIRAGKDLTIVTYGACIRVAQVACERLAALGIDVELIDVRTLLPFDTKSVILASIQKTNAVMFMDEDVPGGATAFMMQQVLEEQGGYDFLDAMPRTLSSQPHRAAYGSDGDYFSKPNAEDVFDYAYSIMRERDPETYRDIRS